MFLNLKSVVLFLKISGQNSLGKSTKRHQKKKKQGKEHCLSQLSEKKLFCNNEGVLTFSHPLPLPPPTVLLKANSNLYGEFGMCRDKNGIFTEYCLGE